MKRIRTILVDDERLARQKLRTLLERDREIEIVAECRNADDAVAAVLREEPDLLFLDIVMPGMDGFDVLRRLGKGRLPAIVFVTAHDSYAARAFEVEAIDYVLKPFDVKRFDAAMRRARRSLENDRDLREENILRLLQTMQQPRLDHFVVKVTDRTLLVAANDVDWIEAEGKYVRLHCGMGNHLVREAIGDVEDKLDSRRFLRIHRGTIVNVKRISELQPAFAGSMFVVLRDGTRLTMSRRYRTRIREVTGMDV